MCSHIVYYARGFGSQFIHVVPTLQLTVVITSDRSAAPELAATALLQVDLIPAAIKADSGTYPAEM